MTTKDPVPNSSLGLPALGLYSRVVLVIAIIGVVLSGITPDFFARMISL